MRFHFVQPTNISTNSNSIHKPKPPFIRITLIFALVVYERDKMLRKYNIAFLLFTCYIANFYAGFEHTHLFVSVALLLVVPAKFPVFSQFEFRQIVVDD